MKPPSKISVRLTVQISLVLAVCIQLSSLIASQQIGEQQINSSNKSKDLAALVDDKSQQANQTTSSPNHGRSMEPQPKPTITTEGRSKPAAAAGRSGRMLDLDHLAGDLNKSDKLSRDQSQSGNRQSRILSEDLPVASGEKVEARAPPSGRTKSSGKKMSIKGFIPIVGLDNTKDGKQLESQLDGLMSSNEDEQHDDGDGEQSTGGEINHQPSGNANSLREQVAANFGGQTSIGHASFANYPSSSSQQDGQYDNQWQQHHHHQQAGRANRKLLDGGNLLSGLANSRRFGMGSSGLLTSASQYDVNSPQLQNPMNAPPVASYLDQHQQYSTGGGECICVPFFQCKNGYLIESQLSKSQLIQFATSMQPNNGLFPAQLQPNDLMRSLANNNRHQQQQGPTQDSNDLFLTGQPSLVMQPQQSQQNPTSQPNDMQMANHIYEQLRKNIESSNLEQQVQAAYMHQQQQQPRSLIDEISTKSNPNSSLAEGDERSLFNTLANKRSSPFNQAKCGIMRTCCKIPPKLILNAASYQQQHQQQAAIPMPTNQMTQLVNPIMRRPTNRMSVIAGPRQQPSGYPHQLLDPPRLQTSASQTQLFNQQPAMDYNNNHHHHLHSSSPLVHQHHQQPHQSLATTNNEAGQLFQQPQHHYQNHQQQRPMASGNFMSGRCGIRQTLGISGRVQNSQTSQQGAENSAEFGEFPAHAAILKRLSPGDSLFVCSAVLISNQWLATAAHCVRKHRIDELKIRLGEWDVSRDDEFYPFVESNVREIVVHPEFQATSLANDLALIRLEQPIDQQQMPHVAPACIGSPSEQSFVGQRCWLAGWGKDAFGQRGSFQSILKKVDLPVVSHQDCELAMRHQTKLGKHFRLHVNNICAGGEQGKDACEGDGGAGLYCIDAQSGLSKAVGLVSWGVGCGQVGVPGVYLNLANFYAWIESVVSSSGEDTTGSNGIYLDGRQQLTNQAADFKSIISERTINGTAAAHNSSSSIATTTTTTTTIAPVEVEYEVESRNAPTVQLEIAGQSKQASNTSTSH